MGHFSGISLITFLFTRQQPHMINKHQLYVITPILFAYHFVNVTQQRCDPLLQTKHYSIRGLVNK